MIYNRSVVAAFAGVQSVVKDGIVTEIIIDKGSIAARSIHFRER